MSSAGTHSPAQSPGRPAEYLTPHQVAAEFSISLSGAYALARKIPSHKVPGMGLLFRRSDIVAWIEQHRRAPRKRGTLRAGTSRSGRSGMKRAEASSTEEVIPGLTRDALKAATGL